MSFVQVTSDIIGFYFKIFILYLLILGYLNRTNDFNRINKALLANLILFSGFIYLEYFFGIAYSTLYKTVYYTGGSITQYLGSQRGTVSLIGGPMVHWATTAQYLVSGFSVIIYFYKKERKYFKSILIILLYLSTIFLVGARSAMVASIIVVIILFIFDSKKNKLLINITFSLAIISIFILSPYSQFLIDSFSTSGGSQAQSFYRRVIVQILMIDILIDAPLIGYGVMGRHDSQLFQFQEWSEVNLYFKEILDFGIIMATFSLIFYLSILFKLFSFKNSWRNTAAYSWIGILLCFISSGTQKYEYYIIPIIYYVINTPKCISPSNYLQ